MYQHSEKGGKLLIDGHNAFRQYHLGPCSDFTSVLFGGLSPLLTGKPLKVGGLSSLSACGLTAVGSRPSRSDDEIVVLFERSIIRIRLILLNYKIKQIRLTLWQLFR